jgi:cytochrome c-type biogenesis protein CcmE
MTPRARARLRSVLLVVFGLSLALTCVLVGLSDKITYFHTPSDLATLTDKQINRTIRIGGLVKTGTLAQDGDTHNFVITDNKAEVSATYRGVLPDLFREGQGVIAYGKYDRENHTFTAGQILAKHDEYYMPPDLKKALDDKK